MRPVELSYALFPAQGVGGQHDQFAAVQRFMVPHQAGEAVFPFGQAQGFLYRYSVLDKDGLL